MPQDSRSPSPRAALISWRWDGFRSVEEIADHLDRWSVATLTERLRTLAGEGLLWSITEIIDRPVRKFAHVRNDAAILIVPGPRKPLRRAWRPIAAPITPMPAQICAGTETAG